ncbi:unnamed protein product, partial [Ixodes hexagonus]
PGRLTPVLAVLPSQWQASVNLIDADLKVESSVFYPPLIGSLIPALGTPGMRSEASFRQLHFRYATQVLSRNITISGSISHVQVEVDLVPDGSSGKMALHDFRIKSLGRVSVRVDGLWVVDYCLGAVLELALVLGHSRMHRIGETVGGQVIRQSLAAKDTAK